MSPRQFLLGSALIASCMIGCAHKPAPAPAAAPTPAAAPAPVAAPTPDPTPAPETPPAAPAAPAPECTAPTDCASKGEPAKGMQWACTDSKCAEEKKGKKKPKK